MEAFGTYKKDMAPSFDPSFRRPIFDLHTRYKWLPANATCELLLLVCASSVNPSDLHPSVATLDHPKAYGSDIAGVVLNMTDPFGKGSCRRFAPGDRVYGDIGANTHFSGFGEAKTKELGAYAQYAVAFEAQLGHMPANVGFVEAAAIPKVALTSYKAFKWYAGAPWSRPNVSVLILGGSGGTGSTGIQLAKALGAATVTVTTSAKNFHYCRSLGADHLIDYHSEHWWDVVADGTVDVVYDTVGEQLTGSRAIHKLRRGGAYVTITGALAPAGTVPAGVTQSMFINSDTNLGSANLLEELRDLIEKNTLRMRRIDSHYGLRKINDAFDRSSSGHVVGKVSVVVEPPSPSAHLCQA